MPAPLAVRTRSGAAHAAQCVAAARGRNHPSPEGGEAWEYSVLLTIRNDRGEEIARQVVGVGALQPGDGRTFTLAVEIFTPGDARAASPGGASG